jgi:xanthine dehydrogenase YagR molybdenum-binding subunit
MDTTASITLSPIGRALPRVDGPLKVSGTATYTADYHFPGLLFAVPVPATITSGSVEQIDISIARAMPGVRAIYTRETLGRYFRVIPMPDLTSNIDEERLPFEDDVIRYYGQYVAVAVAETLAEAEAAARAVRVTYIPQPFDVSHPPAPDGPLEVESERGDAATAFAAAPVKVDRSYATPIEAHNPIEAHATIAVWDGPNVTFYESTQNVENQQTTMAQMLGIPRENVRVVMRFLGSGFGCKLTPWTHCLLAAAAAEHLNRPVKVVISRKMMFQTVGHRPRTQQRIRLGATAEGRLTAIQHDYLSTNSILDNVKEICGEATPSMYSAPNLRVSSGAARRNFGVATSMRCSGAAPGLYALESAIDELAIQLSIDPVELRLRNEPMLDESQNLPFSSRHLKECLTVGADRFGWSRRDPSVGSMRRDGLILGWGVAAASWHANIFDCEAAIEYRADGRLRVTSGAQDIGTGTYTMFAQVASEATGVPLDRIDVVLGDSSLPKGPLSGSGGSAMTASLIPAVMDAARNAQQRMLIVAAATPGLFKGAKTSDLAMTAGSVHHRDQPASSGVPFDKVLAAARTSSVSGQGRSTGHDQVMLGTTKPSVSLQSFLAHFVEVTWQPEIARLRLSRIVTTVDAGRIINELTARNQIEGAVAMGIGMALFEEVTYDPRSGAPINSNLADYILTTHADAPPHEVVFLQHPDLHLNELGARGIGEIGLAGIAAAITSAIHHATGVRVRELPVRVEDLLRSEID